MSMAHDVTPDKISSDVRSGIFGKMILMSGSAVVLSAATIIYFNSTFAEARLEGVYNSLELAAITLMPYMISAAVAAITAIAILAMMPTVTMSRPAEAVCNRLRLMAIGDLETKIPIQGHAPAMHHVVNELNVATTSLGNLVAQWKLINRQQWELLEAIRGITIVNNNGQIVKIVEQMESNWEKIAEIESQLIT